VDLHRKAQRVYELFDAERIEASKGRLAAVWEGRMPEDRLPFVFSYYPFESALHGLPMDFACYDVEQTANYFLDACIAHAALDDDYIPSIFPGLRQGALASAFGCPEYRIGDQFYVRPIIHAVDDIYKIEPPNVRATGLTKFFIDRVGALHRATGGVVPVHCCDMQGVVSVAAKLWNDTDLMFAFYDHPDAVHHLFGLITDAFIEFARGQIEAAQGTLIPIHCMHYAWIPPGQAMSISEDYLGLISPEVFVEFIKPCLEKISDAFGGLVIHSCGSFKNLLGELKKVRGLRALNFGVSETSLQDAARHLSPGVMLIPHATTVSCGGLSVLSQEEHVERTIAHCVARRIPAQALIHVEPGDVPINGPVISREKVAELNQLAVTASRITAE